MSIGPPKNRLGETPQVSCYLGVPLKTLYAWRQRGYGPPAIKVGRHLRYRWADVEAWLDAHTDAPGPET
jgi:excisionase family DNA binding protein